jgi:hypothetical protein
MGKPQAFTEACSVMKDEIDREAQQILLPKSSLTKPTDRTAERSLSAESSQTVERQATPESGTK